ncbi:OLC1v1021480C1 [Oldenlandia corymbosa var. corymbosa]|uniref:OLC1v1021480C1 n=1 Tax=Oldenlandia corymbosa var. corymbosa TaxID=529605 RepID=A0AAV1BVS2_OLDCO|nr:OLC1v1021480C1 [Oldenlandia corymbosa var. corymbosa]
MPAQKRSPDASPTSSPPPSSPSEQPPEEKDDDSLQRSQDLNGEQADDDGEDSDGSVSSTDEQKDEFVFVKLSEIRKEVQCPICLGIIRKTRTVMECLHRFCRECIDKSMRLGNNECPACRTHCASRRSLRDDPNYDALIAAIYPDIDKYEEEELAFHEEERARNKQIQDSIAQTFRRQTEALGRKRSARVTTSAYARRSHGNYRNVRSRRNNRSSEHQGSDDEDDVNGNFGGKDSSSADERSPEIKPRRQKRWSGARYSQSSAAANSDAAYDENESEINRELLGASAGLVGSPEILAWGKGGLRSSTRYGVSAGSSKFARSGRLSKLMDCLRCSDRTNEELDIELVAMDNEDIPSLQRPYLSCKPTLSVRHLCQYVALQISMQADELEIWWKKELKKEFPSENNSEPLIASVFLDKFKDEKIRLDEHQTLGEIRRIFNSSQCNLVLAYKRK